MADKKFVITRVFDASRDRVWKAFTNLDDLKQWWGPKGFTWIHGALDFSVGGMFHYGMRSADGHTMWGKWVFREVSAPESLAFVSSFADESGKAVRHPMSQTWPIEMLGKATFVDQAGKTVLTNRVSAFNATPVERDTFVAGFDSMTQGFNATWDQLASYLAKV